MFTAGGGVASDGGVAAATSGVETACGLDCMDADAGGTCSTAVTTDWVAASSPQAMSKGNITVKTNAVARCRVEIRTDEPYEDQQNCIRIMRTAPSMEPDVMSIKRNVRSTRIHAYTHGTLPRVSR